MVMKSIGIMIVMLAATVALAQVRAPHPPLNPPQPVIALRDALVSPLTFAPASSTVVAGKSAHLVMTIRDDGKRYAYAWTASSKPSSPTELPSGKHLAGQKPIEADVEFTDPGEYTITATIVNDE